jgi:monothiol glutaredoxin
LKIEARSNISDTIENRDSDPKKGSLLQRIKVPDVDVKTRIEDQLGSHDVLLYMKGTPDFPQCGFSGQTVAALNAVGKPYSYVNIFEDPEIREGLKEYSNWPTFPQLYVKGELIGGCDIVIEMYQSGELQKLIEESTPGP